jgi:ankyrin repeat protein
MMSHDTLQSVLSGSLECCQLLLDHGASINCKDRSGKTSLDLAIRAKKQPIIEKLRQLGGLSAMDDKKINNEKLSLERNITHQSTNPVKHEESPENMINDYETKLNTISANLQRLNSDIAMLCKKNQTFKERKLNDRNTYMYMIGSCIRFRKEYR